jgi:hypothetical protein
MDRLTPKDWEELQSAIDEGRQLFTKAQLIATRKEERERCAKLCDKMATEARTRIETSYDQSIKDVAMSEAANKLAEAIRKRGEK